MTQTLFISEFSGFPPYMGHPMSIAELPPIAQQTVTMTSTSAQSTSFQPNTRVVRLHLDSGGSATSPGACVRVGTNPTALTTDLRLALNQTEYFFVNNGVTVEKVAAISSSV